MFERRRTRAVVVPTVTSCAAHVPLVLVLVRLVVVVSVVSRSNVVVLALFVVLLIWLLQLLVLVLPLLFLFLHFCPDLWLFVPNFSPRFGFFGSSFWLYLLVLMGEVAVVPFFAMALLEEPADLFPNLLVVLHLRVPFRSSRRLCPTFRCFVQIFFPALCIGLVFMFFFFIGSGPVLRVLFLFCFLPIFVDFHAASALVFNVSWAAFEVKVLLVGLAFPFSSFALALGLCFAFALALAFLSFFSVAVVGSDKSTSTQSLEAEPPEDSMCLCRNWLV